jgi:hypothetical protein
MKETRPSLPATAFVATALAITSADPKGARRSKMRTGHIRLKTNIGLVESLPYGFIGTN